LFFFFPHTITLFNFFFFFPHTIILFRTDFSSFLVSQDRFPPSFFDFIFSVSFNFGFVGLEIVSHDGGSFLVVGFCFHNRNPQVCEFTVSQFNFISGFLFSNRNLLLGSLLLFVFGVLELLLLSVLLCLGLFWASFMDSEKENFQSKNSCFN